MVLREAASADVGALCDAWFAMLAETGTLIEPVVAGWREPLHDHFARGLAQGRHHWRVIEVDGAIVATGALFLLQDAAITALSGRTATVGGIFTYPSFRRRGYARAVMGELVSLARTFECASVRLRASVAGRSLYEQFGFRSADEMVLPLA